MTKKPTYHYIRYIILAGLLLAAGALMLLAGAPDSPEAERNDAVERYNNLPVPSLSSAQLPSSFLGANLQELPYYVEFAPVTFAAADERFNGHIIVEIDIENDDPETVIGGILSDRAGWIYVYGNQGQDEINRTEQANNGEIDASDIFPKENFYLYGKERTGPFAHFHNPNRRFTENPTVIYLQVQPGAPVTVDSSDSDSDGLNDSLEAILTTAPDNADTDNDGVNDGDEFQAGSNPIVQDGSDGDSDNIFDVVDNCPDVANTDQTDTDSDDIGDACDPDDDEDGIADAADNCPLADNPEQSDVDLDGTGDVCDDDFTTFDVLSDVTAAVTGAVGESASMLWFFDLNQDGSISQLDLNLLENWNDATADEVILAATLLHTAIGEHTSGHSHSMHAESMMELDFNNDGKLDAVDQKLLIAHLVPDIHKYAVHAVIAAIDYSAVSHNLHDDTTPMSPSIYAGLSATASPLSVYDVSLIRDNVTTSYLVMVGDNDVSGLHVKERRHAHAFDAEKADEHMRLFDLVPIEDATFAAKKSGNWSDETIWVGDNVPQAGGRVWIPSGIEVTYDIDDTDNTLAWLRVDGSLAFASGQNTGLKVIDFIVDPTGSVSIGSADARIGADYSAEILLADRGPRDRIRDPIDIGGGLIVHGTIEMYGAEKQSYALVNHALGSGMTVLSFDEAPQAWAVGDQVIVPTTRFADTDEQYTIAAMSADGRQITLNQPLVSDRPAPEDIMLPVGNITRNILIHSEVTDVNERRGHMMVMHNHGAHTVIDSAAFVDLGRTRVDTLVTDPVVVKDADGNDVTKAGTDENTRGRYALHFHMRSGVSFDSEPHVVRNTAIVGSPRHGLVNHGGYVIAQDNVGYNNAGSHFFAENGSEIGVFERNLAVRSAGSGIAQTSSTHKYRGDFGHGGHGFWAQAGGVVVRDNYAFGHADTAYNLNAFQMFENGKIVRFPVANLYIDGLDEAELTAMRTQLQADGVETINVRDVPYYYANNVAAGCKVGFGSWEIVRPEHPEGVTAVVENFDMWNITSIGLEVPYAVSTILRNITVSRDVEKFSEANNTFGIRVNGLTSDLLIDNVRVEGYRHGLWIPFRGETIVQNSYFNSRATFLFNYFANRLDQYFLLKDSELGPNTETAFYLRYDPHHIQSLHDRLDLVFRNYGRMLVENTHPELDGKQIIYSRQFDDYVPFKETGIEELDEKTVEQIWDEYHMGINGPRPINATGSDLVAYGGISDPIPSYTPLYLKATADPASASTWATNQLEDFVAHVFTTDDVYLTDSEPVDLKEGWNFIPVTVNGEPRTVMVHGDTTPPERLELNQTLPEAYHPDDLPRDLYLNGYAYDKVAHLEDRISFGYLYRNLKEVDGKVTITATVTDGAGNVRDFVYEIPVSTSAPRL